MVRMVTYFPKHQAPSAKLQRSAKFQILEALASRPRISALCLGENMVVSLPHAGETPALPGLGFGARSFSGAWRLVLGALFLASVSLCWSSESPISDDQPAQLPPVGSYQLRIL